MPDNRVRLGSAASSGLTCAQAAAAAADHPGIVPPLAVDPGADGTVLVASPYLDGGSPADLLATPEPLPLDTVFALVRDVAEVLAHAPALGPYTAPAQWRGRPAEPGAAAVGFDRGTPRAALRDGYTLRPTDASTASRHALAGPRGPQPLGYLSVSAAGGAPLVLVDGRSWGAVPVVVGATPGAHHVAVRADGMRYRPAGITLRVKGGDTTAVAF